MKKREAVIASIILVACLAWLRFTAPQAATFAPSTVVAVLKGADMNSTADQALAVNHAGKFVVRRIIVTGASTSLTLAAGGVYTGASKSGTTVVAAAQVYTALTGSTKFVDLTLASGVTGDVVTSATLILSLTVAQGGAATADIYVIGDQLP